MNRTLLRQWSMLQQIPRHPRRVDTQTIRTRLADRGIKVSLRTIQRDLVSLSEVFPLDYDESKPQGWWWRKGAAQLEIPGIDPHAALTFSLVEQYMKNLLPPATLSHLAPWFEAAKGVTNSEASLVTRWREKIRVVPHTFNKVPPKINAVIQATVYDALLQGRQLELTYKAISTGKEGKTYPVHPLGLIVMEQVIYLVCTAKSYAAPRFLAMHRIEAAIILNANVVRPKAFDIDEFITKEFGIRIGNKPIKLKMKVRGLLTKYLIEAPVAPGQKLERLKDEWMSLEAEVQDTIALRSWIRSLGADAVVEMPKGLRRELSSGLQFLVEQYKKH